MMHRNVKANQTSAAAHNRRLVVQLLRKHESLSRIQLAEITGLRTSTLTYIVRELIDARMVRTVGKRESKTVGKKQMLLEINPDLGWVVGVGMEGDTASLVYLDAAGEVIDRDRLQMSHDVKLVPQLLRNRVEAWTSHEGEPAGNLLGVGVGVSGVVDTHQGVILRSTWFDTAGYPLRQLIADTFKARVTIDNDANFAALAESRVGSALNLRNFLYFLVNAEEEGDHYQMRGFGSTLFLDGSLYRGAHYAAGEVDTLLESESAGRVTAEQLLELAKSDGVMTDALRQVARQIGTTVAALVDLIDPEAVILGGNVMLCNSRMLDVIETEMNARLIPLPNRSVSVRPTTLMDHGVSIGAALAALDDALLDIDLITPPATGAGDGETGTPPAARET